MCRSTSQWRHRCGGSVRTPARAAHRPPSCACRPSAAPGDPPSIARLNASLKEIGSIRKTSRAVFDRTTVAFFSPSTRARPTRACAGVTRASHSPDKCGVSSGTGTSRRRSPRSRAYSRIIPPYETTSGPPISKIGLSPLSGRSSAASRYESTSVMAMGWVSVATQRGQIITGSRSTSA